MRKTEENKYKNIICHHSHQSLRCVVLFMWSKKQLYITEELRKFYENIAILKLINNYLFLKTVLRRSCDLNHPFFKLYFKILLTEQRFIWTYEIANSWNCSNSRSTINFNCTEIHKYLTYALWCKVKQSKMLFINIIFSIRIPNVENRLMLKWMKFS